jgi:hypothetical protein
MVSPGAPSSGATSPPAAPAPTGAGLLGSGLGAGAMAAILAFSVALFLFWNGPLWNAPTGARHLGRIAVSYLAVVPLGALALALRRRWSFIHLLSSVALLWSAKMVITASLYGLLTSGSASRYEPAPWRAPSPPAAAELPYRAAAEPGERADLDGTLREAGAAVAGAVIWASAPPPGLPLGAPREVTLTIREGRYLAPVYLASIRDQVRALNQDGVLHTLRLEKDHRVVRNLPLPPGAAAPAITDVAPGVYSLSCENHRSDRATLVIVDHPYAAETDSAGHFQLHGLPPGPVELAIARAGRAPSRRSVQVSAPRATVSIELSEGQ